MRSAHDLKQLINQIDHRGYRSYRDLRGSYSMGEATLFIDHVQADPFAAPSRLRIRLPGAETKIPPEWISPGIRNIAMADFLSRQFRSALQKNSVSQSPRDSTGHGRSGSIKIDAGGQEVLERSALLLNDEWAEVRLEVGLPAEGRRVLGAQAHEILLHRIPALAQQTLCWSEIDTTAAKRHVQTVENQEHIRRWLCGQDLVAFVADGSILPRISGASQRPMPNDQAIPFQSPQSLSVEAPLLNPIEDRHEPRNKIRGMGIPKGVTLIVGGGYHGKSTLLQALESAVYPHVPGDGREYVVTHPDLVKIRAEDGRSVTAVDIHGFIDQIPSRPGEAETDARERTRSFSTPDASGSTSQAAGIAEAIEAGAAGILLDEDTSATNFMVRDARMQQLVHRDHEPITPFVDRVRELFEHWDVSTLLVMGGSGDYFEVADTVIRLKDYRAEDVTAQAQEIAAASPNGRSNEATRPLSTLSGRLPIAESFNASKGRSSMKISARGRETLIYGDQDVDLRQVTQIAEASQTRAIGLAIYQASQNWMASAGQTTSMQEQSLPALLDQIADALDLNGLDWLGSDKGGRPTGPHSGRLSRPRRHEIAAALNRMRALRVEPGSTSPPTRPDASDAPQGDPEKPGRTSPA